MPKQVVAHVHEVHDCPIYQTGDRLTFALPDLITEDCDAVCAIAVADLLPWTIKVTAGGEGASGVLLCRGCRGGRAQAGFTLEAYEPAARDPRITRKLGSLRSISLFAPLPDRELDKIEPMIQEVGHEPGEDIITYGQPGEALSIITKGQVEVLKPGDEGEEKLLAILSPGECFGEMSLLTGDPCTATIRPREGSVKTMTVTKADFDRLLARNPVLNRYFSKLLALRLNRMSKQLTDQETGAVTGELQMIGPTELIQAITVTDRSGTLRIESGPQWLECLFHSGQIWRIEAPGEDAEEAFYDFLEWTRGRFSFEPIEESESATERNVFKDTTSLLLEGMRRADESQIGPVE